jgi:hypothetical protein
MVASVPTRMDIPQKVFGGGSGNTEIKIFRRPHATLLTYLTEKSHGRTKFIGIFMRLFLHSYQRECIVP